MGEAPKFIEFYENQCCICFAPFWQKRRGRLRRTCSQACRQKLYLMRRSHLKEQESVEAVPSRAETKHKFRRTHQRVLTHCPVCGEEMSQAKRGRKRKTCSDRCRKWLWRYENPRCMVCGKTFKMPKFQKQQKYCSSRCRSHAWEAFKRTQEIAKRREALGNSRPFWMPRLGSGYRKEVFPEMIGETSAIWYEREPEANYEPPDPIEERRKAEAEEAEEVRKIQTEVADIKRRREEARIAKERHKTLWEDDTLWWEL